MQKNFQFFFVAALIFISNNFCFAQPKGWLQTDSLEFAKLIPLIPDARVKGKPLPHSGWGTLKNFHEGILSTGRWLSPYGNEELQITQAYPIIKGTYREIVDHGKSVDTMEGDIIGKYQNGKILLVKRYINIDTSFQQYFIYCEGYCYNSKLSKYPFFLGKRTGPDFFYYTKIE